MPKILMQDWTTYPDTPHSISGQNDGPWAKRRLGDIAGLQQFGVHLERIPPGSRSSHSHWHENEDEFVYLISG